MPHINSPKQGTTISYRNDGTPVLHMAYTSDTKAYNISIHNKNFHLQKNKEALINMLIDLFYEMEGDIEGADIKDELDVFKQIISLEHEHDWRYVDCGDYVANCGYLFRFLCANCGNYKFIEQINLRENLNQLLDSSESAQPTKKLSQGMEKMHEAEKLL
jgi:hypothetical protein